MKINLFLFLMLVLSQTGFSQKTISYGVYFNGAFSSFIDLSPEDEQFTAMDYGFKPAIGGGFILNHTASEKMDYQLSTGFMQRGTLFATNEAIPAPRFNLNYIDLMLGINYKPFVSGFSIGAGLSQHTLLSAKKNDFFINENAKADFNSFDIGLFFKAGYELPIGDSKIIFNILLNTGGLNVYKGMSKENGLNGRNVLAGIQVGYILGRKTKS